MQDPTTPQRIVTVEVSSTILAQGAFMGFDTKGLAKVDTGGKVARGKLISKLTKTEAK
jgi:hypothetical protein